jgi:BlaI family transcriptional regulator, penicillinase repressor
MRPIRPLSELQIAVLRPLWDRGELTVSQVHAAVHAYRQLAATTVATVLSRLEKQGLVAHRAEGRQYVFRALVSAGDVRRSMVAGLVERLFDGDSIALVSQLLQEADFAADDLAKVRALIEAKEQERS